MDSSVAASPSSSSSTSADLFDPLFNVPSEVLVDPQPFIALCGLDTVHNPTHRIIWDSFSTNRNAERLPILYRLLPTDHEFPLSKLKKSYEYGTVPGGILKKNWIQKHMYEVPALVVLFVDLEWDDAAFNEKKIACSSKIATLRTSLAGRSTRLALVMIQQRPHTLAPGEPSPDAEKITSLCNACELTLKQVFFLPHNDSLTSYVVRLETALFETVQQYYLNESKRVRGHRDAVMRMASLNLPLLVRHQFKIGYFNEFRQDKQTSLKHYQQAYLNLQQIRQDGGFEVKTVAMIIMYRICRLSFRLACPLDAISNFRKHLEIFRTYRGPPDLAYQHEAWLFRQNLTFAQLFEEAIQGGLIAVPSENPGMYYMKAADHMKARQKNCLNFPVHTLPFVPSPPVDGEFYGQLILNVPAASSDIPIALYLQNCERAVNHTAWMVHLLKSAITQFKRHRCLRTALMLFNRLGDEYCDVGAYEKAQSLFAQGLSEYRKSKWSVVFSQLLLRQIKVSALIANVPEYIKGSLEAIGAESYLQHNDRVQLQETLLQILAGERPDFRNILGPQSQLGYQRWGSLNPETLRCTLDMDQLLPCIEGHCSFDQESFSADQTVSLTVRISTTSPLPLPFHGLQVHLSNPVYNSSCASSESFVVTEENEHVLTFKFVPANDDVGRRIDITKVVLRLGTSTQHCDFAVVWSNFSSGKLRKRSAVVGGTQFKLADEESSAIHSTDITRRTSKVELSMCLRESLLVGETYKLPVVIKNHEGSRITNGQLGISCSDEAGKITFSAVTLADPEVQDGSVQFMNDCLQTVESLAIDDKKEMFFLVRCSVGLKAQVRVVFSYDVETAGSEDGSTANRTFRCQTESSAVLVSQNPLQIRFLSKEFHSEEYPSDKHIMPLGENILYFVVIRNASPVKITLDTADLRINSEMMTMPIKMPSYIKGLSLNENEEAQELIVLRLKKSACSPGAVVSLGPLLLTWRVANAEAEQPVAVSHIPVPDLTVKATSTPLKVHLTVPSKVTQFEPLSLSYRIENCSDQLMDLYIVLSTNDEYVLHGEKESRMKVGPRMDVVVRCAIVPINVGYMRLPEFEIHSDGDLDAREWIETHLPKTVFVMPKEIPRVVGPFVEAPQLTSGQEAGFSAPEALLIVEDSED